MNAIMMAASMSFTSVVARLLEAGGDYTAKNKVLILYPLYMHTERYYS